MSLKGNIPWNKGLKTGKSSSTSFKPGHTPWSKGKKTGIIPKSAFKKGQTSWNKGKVGVMPIPLNKGIDNKKTYECLVCFTRFKSYSKRKYCSRKCSAIDKKGENHPNWIGGGWLTVRKQILIEQDYTCQVCGLREKDIMEVNHKLERSTHPELSRDKENLEVLCPNCHRRKTNQFLKNKNKNI